MMQIAQRIKYFLSHHRKKILWLGWLAGAGLFLLQIFNSYFAYRSSGQNLIVIDHLLLALLMPFLCIGLQMLAWRLIMSDLGVKLTLKDVMRGYLLSFLPRYIPGTIWGYLSRNEWLYQAFGIRYDVTNIGSVYELATAISANIVIIGLAFSKQYVNFWIGLMLAVGFCTCVWWLIRLASNFLISRFHQQINWLEIVGKIRLRIWMLATLIFFMTWILYGVSVCEVFASLTGISDACGPAVLLNYAGVYSSAWLVGFLILIVPAGLGFREMAMAKLLVEGLSMPGLVANTAALGSRFLILVAEVAWLVIGFAWRIGGKWKSSFPGKIIPKDY